MSFKCPHCQSRTGIYNTQKAENSVKRYRKCPKCRYTFATREQLEAPFTPLNPPTEHHHASPAHQ